MTGGAQTGAAATVSRFRHRQQPLDANVTSSRTTTDVRFMGKELLELARPRRHAPRLLKNYRAGCSCSEPSTETSKNSGVKTTIVAVW
jgi:hypothetical protein